MPNESTTPRSSTLSFVLTIVLTIALVMLVRMYIAKPFIVQGASMDPTFASWHYLIIDELSYNFLRAPERGEVVVFRYPDDPSKHFIKRIIGLPGETVEIDGEAVYISNSTEQNFKLTEPYVIFEHRSENHLIVTLAEDEYYVLGDNRAESADSRFFGPLKEHLLVGRAWIRLFPFTQISYLPGEATYTEDTK